MRLRTLSALALALAVPVILSIVVEAAGTCFVGGHLYNRNRVISEGGVIDAECYGTIHSAPFGNWGMYSIFGSREDRHQFAGWHWSDKKWQWNSCTWHPDFDAPPPLYYNEPRQGPRVSQKSRQGELRADSGWLMHSPRQTCQARWHNKVYSIDGFETRLYDLDWPDDSEHTATLKYGNLRIRMSCSSTWLCEGRWGWRSPNSVSPSNSKVSAEAYILLSTAEK